MFGGVEAVVAEVGHRVVGYVLRHLTVRQQHLKRLTQTQHAETGIYHRMM